MLIRFGWGVLVLLLAACDDAQGSSLLASTGSAGASPLTAASALDLHVQQGELIGHPVIGGVREFLGVPFAEPPVEALRWALPVPKAAWPAPLVADHFGPRCPQASSHGMPNPLESEDCLYLSVWAPAEAHSAPVMVWIHGGGNRDGTASDFFTGGAALAARYGVVVVALNYRLGVLGFVAHPQLHQEHGSAVANQGLWDQRLAMQWTHTNIAAFGGDPDNITIFGESAGSADVCLHMVAPASRGLFARAISESGGCTTRRRSLAAAERDSAQLAEQLGCSADNALSCLRGAAVPSLFAATDALGARGVGFGPVVDGDFTPDQPRALFDRGEIAHVPYLLGTNSDEGSAFTLDAASITNDEQYMAALERLGPDPNEVQLFYPVSKFSSAQNPYQAAFARAWGDARMVCSTLDVAVRAERARLPVFLYNFDISMDGPNGVFGAAHAFEIGFVFGTNPTFTLEERAVSDRMQGHWTQFAKTGDPNGPELYPWPLFRESANVRINFAETSSVIQEFRAPECTYWRLQYDKAF
ncbi:MAG TPA: carboxylesterase family protein [Polyangiales bacterium]|nr:carboxylesterase family protein [Polyangiales bacterium]